MGWGDTSFNKMLAMPAWRYEFYPWNPHEINLRQADQWISRGSQDSWTWASSQWGCLKRLGCTAGEWHSEMWSDLYTHTPFYQFFPVWYMCAHLCMWANVVVCDPQLSWGVQRTSLLLAFAFYCVWDSISLHWSASFQGFSCLCLQIRHRRARITGACS